MRIMVVALAGCCSLVAQGASAAVTWNWSFAGQEGTFVTTGDAAGGNVAAGRYTMTNFSVTESRYLVIADMFTVSDEGLAYTTIGGPDEPYTLDWDGQAVTQLNNAQAGFPQNSPRTTYWQFGRHDWSRIYVTFAVANGVSRAGLSNAGFDLDFGDANDAPLSIALTPNAAVPDPASWMTMLTGFAVTGMILRRRRSSTQVVASTAA